MRDILFCCCCFGERERKKDTDILPNKNLCDLNRNDDFNIQICTNSHSHTGKKIFETGQIFVLRVVVYV